MTQRRFVRRVQTRPVKNFSWSGVTSSALTALPAASKIVVASFILSTAFDETITRIRGVLSITSDQVTATETPQGSFGAIIVSEDAFAIGITAIPSPGNDIANDGWMMWHGFIVPKVVASIASFQEPAGHQLVIDSKAQRILREGSRLVFVLENTAAAAGLNFAVQLRVLSRFRS